MNIWAIIVCVVFSLVLGMYWYSPSGFGNTWMRAMGITPAMVAKYKKQNKSMAKEYATVLVAALISIVVLQHLVARLGLATALQGAGLGALVAIGFNLMPNVSSVLFENKPKAVYLINAGYNLVLFTVVGAVLAVWS